MYNFFSYVSAWKYYGLTWMLIQDNSDVSLKELLLIDESFRIKIKWVVTNSPVVFRFYKIGVHAQDNIETLYSFHSSFFQHRRYLSFYNIVVGIVVMCVGIGLTHRINLYDFGFFMFISHFFYILLSLSLCLS